MEDRIYIENLYTSRSYFHLALRIFPPENWTKMIPYTVLVETNGVITYDYDEAKRIQKEWTENKVKCQPETETFSVNMIETYLVMPATIHDDETKKEIFYYQSPKEITDFKLYNRMVDKFSNFNHWEIKETTEEGKSELDITESDHFNYGPRIYKITMK